MKGLIIFVVDTETIIPLSASEQLKILTFPSPLSSLAFGEGLDEVVAENFYHFTHVHMFLALNYH